MRRTGRLHRTGWLWNRCCRRWLLGARRIGWLDDLSIGCRRLIQRRCGRRIRDRLESRSDRRTGGNNANLPWRNGWRLNNQHIAGGWSGRIECWRHHRHRSSWNASDNDRCWRPPCCDTGRRCALGSLCGSGFGRNSGNVERHQPGAIVGAIFREQVQCCCQVAGDEDAHDNFGDAANRKQRQQQSRGNNPAQWFRLSPASRGGWRWRLCTHGR